MPHRQIKRHITAAPMVRPASPYRERGLTMLRAGATAAQVAAELGVPLTSANAWARSLRLRKQGERGADQEARDPRNEVLPIIDLLLQGESVAEIAAALGRTRQAVESARKLWLSDED